MRKSLINQMSVLCLTVLSGLEISAQITIVQSDMLQVGTDIVMYLDTSTKSLDLGNTGSNQTWDYSSLTSNSQYDSDILDPSGKLLADKFPTATCVLERFGINTQYYQNTSTDVIYLGAVVSTIVDTSVFYYNYSYLKYPASLGSQHTDVSDRHKGTVSPIGFDPDGSGPHPFVDSICHFSKELFKSHIDAEGKIKSPEGEFDVIRQYNEITNVDSAYMYVTGQWIPMSSTISSLLMQPLIQTDTTYAFAWLAKGMNLPVMNIEFDPHKNDEVIATQWMEYTPTRINDYSGESNVFVYPNPVHETLYIDARSYDGIADLINVKGRIVKTVDLSKKQIQLSVDDLNTGTYILVVKGRSGHILSRHKVIIE